MQGRIQDFKMGGSLKINAPTGGRREHFWGISCEKITILRQKIIFFPILGGGGHDGQPPPLDPPLLCLYILVNMKKYRDARKSFEEALTHAQALGKL
jgi:hypothetical protein